MYPLTITRITDNQELKKTKDFLLKQPQLYPNYREWVDSKCIPRIENGIYKNFVAITNGAVIGDVVYRFNDDGCIEIRNFRIDSEYRNRDLGHFLLKQVEKEVANHVITLDVSVDNFLGVQFFIRNGFNIATKEPLYSANQQEYVMQKHISVNPR